MEHTYFENSVNGDRKYKAEDWIEYFSTFLTDGVKPNPATSLQVMATGTDMRVIVGVGKGIVAKRGYYNDAPFYITLTNADGATNRIDRIVLRHSTADRHNFIAVKQGAFATTPVAPDLQRDADYWEIALADVYVGAGATTITQSVITDLRMNTDLCGWINSTIQVDTTAIFLQFQDWFNSETKAEQKKFNDWFSTLKGQLGTDVAGNLQNEIDAIITNVVNLSESVSPIVKVLSYNNIGGAL